jgi:hypothetical protein
MIEVDNFLKMLVRFFSSDKRWTKNHNDILPKGQRERKRQFLNLVLNELLGQSDVENRVDGIQILAVEDH